MMLNSLQALGLSAAVILFGEILKKRIRFLDRYNFPSPVIGGLCFALVFFLLKWTDAFEFQFDMLFQEPLMIAFFASLGFGASWNSLKAGGAGVIRFLILCSLVLVLQTMMGVLTAKLLGVPALLGVIASSVSLVGGPGTALAFAPLFEAAGIEGAKTFGLSCAIAGILVGGVLGTPVTMRLVRRFGLRSSEVPSRKSPFEVEVVQEEHHQFGFEVDMSKDELNLLRHVLALSIILAIGTALSRLISQSGITLPIYIGSMIVAAALRNIDDRFKVFRLNEKLIDEIGSVCLALFVGLSAATLDLTQLGGAVLTVVAFHTVQTLLILLVASKVVYRFMGSDYDSAVMSGGFVGFMMGTTANAMANMNAITDRLGPARRAYLIVPLVGACFIDFINAALITFLINILK